MKSYLLRLTYILYIMIQYAIVFLLLFLAYTIRRIRQTFRESKSGCYGCKGCAIKEQMMKKHAKKDPKTKKYECFKEKGA